MNREILFFLTEGEPSTFSKDHLLPSLPLPSLEDTLGRYYESLKPFGTAEQLDSSRKVIESFKNGVGRKLQSILEERARTHKNWVERWWEDYAYCADRTPLLPFTAMASNFFSAHINNQEVPEYALKGMAKCLHYLFEYWELIRNERMRPFTNPSGTITYSSFMLKRIFSTSRIPGEVMDKVESHFKTAAEGDSPSYILVIGKGRLFRLDFLNEDNTILNPQQILVILRQIRAAIDERDVHLPVPVLTCDNRTGWAQNRKYLLELSVHNAEIMDIIEKSVLVLSLDENCPADYNEVGAKNLCGDLHSRWADKCGTFTLFKNGKIGCAAEHSCYDGSVSVGLAFFIFLSCTELPEPDWSLMPTRSIVPPELTFDLDGHMVETIERVWKEVNVNKNTIIFSMVQVKNSGKDFMKKYRLHPDDFIQMIIQLTYYKMHKDFVATYETALMRNYYNGRTETLRSCTVDSKNWVNSYMDKTESDANKLKLLKTAINTHHNLMEAARNGNGIDRHLFGLWCAAYEADMEIPELYDDILYKKSGGGGNFVLSTSLLGYTIANGYVAPMCLDGYGLFYSMTDDTIFLNVTALRESTKTSAHRFGEEFNKTVSEVMTFIEKMVTAKL